MRPLSILRRQNPFVLGIAAVVLALVLWLGTTMAATRWPWIFGWNEVRQANKVIASVNSFQSRYGRLPDTLADMGLEDSGERAQSRLSLKDPMKGDELDQIRRGWLANRPYLRQAQ